MKIFPIIKKIVTEIVGGTANWLPAQTPGIAVSTVATLPTPEVNAGVAVSEASKTARIAQTPGLSVSLLGATGAASATQTPALAQSTVIQDHKTSQTPAMDLVQVTYGLTRRVGSNAAANLGPDNVTNPNNANGIHDGTNATTAGNLTAARDFNLELSYANAVGKSELAITAASLSLYMSVSGDATGLQSTVTVSYDIGAGYVVLETITGNFTNISTPRIYSLTGILDTWTEHDALKVKVRHQTIIAATLVAGTLDAVELEVSASKTDAL